MRIPSAFVYTSVCFSSRENELNPLSLELKMNNNRNDKDFV